MKKWATTVIGWEKRHPSRRAVDRYVENAVDEFRQGTLNGTVREVKIWMDDGSGFNLQETVPLNDPSNPRKPPVDGCRYCGVTRRDHGPLFSFSVDIHRWTDPTEDQVRARGMLS